MGRRIIICAAMSVSACSPTTEEPNAIQFADVTTSTGLRSEATWKYGGPAIADLDNDGRYDLALTNHHEAPAQLFFATETDHFVEREPLLGGDVHGIAAGDYDADGFVDLVVSVGGGNGTSPKPPRLLRNTGAGFQDVTDESGIAGLGARGRSVRWIDLDTDGDLDLLEIAAQQLPGEDGPRNILFENLGNGRFAYRESPAFESIEAERVLISDIDNDHVPDLVTFTPLRIMKSDNAFGFDDVSDRWLAGLTAEQREHAMAVAEADVDDDGDMDLYVARGKTYYEIANNALELDETGRLNLRDEGNAGQDSIEFSAADSIGLLDFWHWPRGIDLTLPVFLGESGIALPTPVHEISVAAAEASGFPETMNENGWYLGHLGDDRWRLGWNLNGDLAWDIRASVRGVSSVNPAWQPQALGVPDLLLINEGTHYRDGSDRLPAEAGDNNWGVITGDLDNDGDLDFFVWRFGKLHGRTADVLVRNDGERFAASTTHGATNLEGGGHGDMGAPFDFDGDGWLDILSGSDNYGYWNLFRNVTGNVSRHRSLRLRIGHSPGGTDPHSAEVTVDLDVDGRRIFRRVGSRGAVHSQGLHNLVHIGVGNRDKVRKVTVRWRDGREVVMENAATGRVHPIGLIRDRN